MELVLAIGEAVGLACGMARAQAGSQNARASDLT